MIHLDENCILHCTHIVLMGLKYNYSSWQDVRLGVR